MTTFADKEVGANLNVEIDRHTQVVVDTVRDAVSEQLGSLRAVLEALLREQGIELENLSHSIALRDIAHQATSDAGEATMATKRSNTGKKRKPKDDPVGSHDDPMDPHGKKPKKARKSKKTKTPKKKK
jgi:hypothetical protein